MRRFVRVGLVRVEKAEWPAVKARLLAAGYLWRPPDDEARKVLWTPDGRACVGQRDGEAGCYWLDERVLADWEGKP